MPLDLRLFAKHGEIAWKGEDLAGLSIKERADKIGYVMQDPNQMISQTMIFDEVALGLRLRKVPEDEVKERVAKVLKICGLYPFRNWPVSALSFGQKEAGHDRGDFGFRARPFDLG